MRYPLAGEIIVTGEFKERAVPGTGLKDDSGVSRHIGVDLRAQSPKAVYAPGSGVVTASYSSGAGQTMEIEISGKLWRFMHLSQRLFSVGARVTEGVKIGMSGNSGGVAYHLHVDVRIKGSRWNDSLLNYFDFRQVIAAANEPKPSPTPKPAPGKRIYFTYKQTATFYPVKGGTYKMSVPAGESWNVIVNEGNRVKVNSRSAGGDCWVYLKLSATGETIPGRYIK